MVVRRCQAVGVNEGRIGVGVEGIHSGSGCHDRSNRQHGLIHAKGRRIVDKLRHGRGRRWQSRQGVDLFRSHHRLSSVAVFSTHLCVHAGSHVGGKLPCHSWNRSKVATAWDSVSLIWLRNSIHGRARFESDRSNRRGRNRRKGRERLIRLMTRGRRRRRRRMTRSKMKVGRNFLVPGIEEHD